MKRRQRIFAGMLCVALSVTTVLTEGFWVEASGLGQQEFVESVEETDEDGTEIGIPECSEVESDVEKDLSENDVIETEEKDGAIEEEAEVETATENGEGEAEAGTEETAEENIEMEMQTESGTEEGEKEEAEIEAVEEETGYGLEEAASGDDIASGKSGDITWVIDKDGKLTVTGTGDFDSYGVPWIGHENSIKTAEINVTDITDLSYMFRECENLVSIDLKGLDTGKVTDMESMFDGCCNLSSLDVSGFDTRNVINMSRMFDRCNSLTNLNITNFNTGNVTDMSNMFNGCSGLTDLDLSNFNTAKVTNMSYMFSESSSLKSLDLGNFDTSNVTDMRCMFFRCSKLEKLNISNFNTKNVTDMENMFYNCKNLLSLNLSSFDMSSLKRTMDLFGSIENLDIIYTPYNLAQSINIPGYMAGFAQSWYQANGRSRMDLPTNLNYSVIIQRGKTPEVPFIKAEKIKSKYECGDILNINDLVILYCDDEGIVTKVDDYTTNIAEINMSEPGKKLLKITYNNMETTVELSVGSFSDDMVGGSYKDITWKINSNGKLTVTGTGEFADMHSLSRKRAPWYEKRDSIITAEISVKGMTNASYIFADCFNLISIDFNGFDTSNVRTMEGMFFGCSSLLEVDLSGFNTINVTDMNYMFEECCSLISVNLNGFNTENVTTMRYMFFGCSNLTNMDISEFDTKNVTDMGGMFRECSNLTSIDVSNFDTSKATSMDAMFSGCSSLESLDLSNFSIQDEVHIYSGIFGSCTSLKKIYTPCNLNMQIKLPSETQYQPDGTAITEFWYRPDGVVITELPLNLEYSIVITRGSIPVIEDSYIVAYKTKKVYECGETLNIDDLTIKYYAADGTVRKVTNYKTNAFEIDMSTAGTKTLVVTYNGLTAEIPIIVQQYFTVTFDLAGHGSPIEPLTGITAGSLIDMPPTPIAEGYDFRGWYKDAAHTQMWDFSSDTVEDNVTLYAYWHSSSVITEPSYTQSGNLLIQEIPTLTYTGSALKPAVTVYYQSGDRKILLTSGKDYTVKYCNNIHADTEKEKELGGIGKTETDNSSGFTKDLAYLVITCKGNYKGTVYQNFHISPAGITTGGQNIAKGFTLKYTEQFVSGNKALKPFSSLKYKKAMKAGTDYTVQLTAEKAYDADRTALKKGSIIDGNNTIPTIPAGYQGTFLLTITGKNNYRGTITKNIYVADKNHLMKNASVTIGKNQKSMRFTGSRINLTPAWFDDSEKKYYAISEAGIRTEADKNNVFTVKIGKEYLLYGKDFTISYSNNRAVGKATMTIIGIGDYIGTKNVTFRITGTAFNTKNIGLEKFKSSLTYTGQMLTQNEVILKDISSANPVGLVCGTDYTVSYKNNLKKGTATMTFTANPSSGYSGSFKKTFKIVPAGLNKITTVDTTDPFKNKIVSENGSWKLESQIIYTKEGAKPSNRIILTNRNNNVVLKEGTDYTVSYANNKTVSTAEKPAVMIVKGKGNYTGTINISFPIVKASLEGNENVTVNATAIAYNAKKTEEYQYRPQIKITDKKKGLSASKDYEIVEYRNCSSAAVKTYLDALANGTATADIRPYVLIRAREESGYKGSMEVDLTIYQTKLTAKNLYVVISSKREQITYTGVQVKPEVTVYFGESESIKQAKKAGEVREAVLTDKTGDYKLKKLNLKENGIGDYTLTYGSNVTAGKNKGSVMINGAGLYGGSVTVKFTILGKDVHNQ